MFWSACFVLGDFSVLNDSDIREWEAESIGHAQSLYTQAQYVGDNEHILINK